LLGRLYWVSVAPFHRFVFPGLLRGIVADSEATPAVKATASPAPLQPQ
jgi:hypothetical protein